MAHEIRIFLPFIKLENIKNLTQITISEKLYGQQYHHIVNVMRVKAGEEFYIFNGVENFEIKCKIGKISKHDIVASIENIDIKTTNGTKNRKNILLIAITKKDQMEDIIRSCTEIGIDEFRFVKTKYSQSEKTINVTRLNDIAISAAMQCKINILPKICDKILSLNQTLQTISGNLLFANETLNFNFHANNKLNVGMQEDLFMLIGPEGGFATDEIDLIKNSSSNTLCVEQISLGFNIMRASTAAIAMCFAGVNNLF